MVESRHSLDDEVDDIPDDGTDELPPKEEVTIFSIFFTKNGIYILGSLIAFSVLYLATDKI